MWTQVVAAIILELAGNLKTNFETDQKQQRNRLGLCMTSISEIGRMWECRRIREPGLRKNGGVTHQKSPTVPAYLRPRNVGLVFVGGALGVLAREGLMLALPDVEGLPLAVFVANLFGAFLLALLLESLARLGPETEFRSAMRLLLGTGLLGGFTTYSALALALAALSAEGTVWLAAGYGLATIVCGVVASWCGVLLGAVLVRRRERGGNA